MSDEQKPKTPAEIERERAAREKSLNPSHPEKEEVPEPETEEAPEPETEEVTEPETEEAPEPETEEAPEPETEEAPEPEAKPKTAAQIERDRLASLAAKSAPEPADSAEKTTDAPEEAMTAGKIEAVLLKKRQEASRAQAEEDESPRIN